MKKKEVSIRRLKINDSFILTAVTDMSTNSSSGTCNFKRSPDHALYLVTKLNHRSVVVEKYPHKGSIRIPFNTKRNMNLKVQPITAEDFRKKMWIRENMERRAFIQKGDLVVLPDGRHAIYESAVGFDDRLIRLVLPNGELGNIFRTNEKVQFHPDFNPGLTYKMYQ